MLNCAPEVTVTRVDKLSFAVMEQFTRTVESSVLDGALLAVDGGAGDDGQERS